MSLADSWERRKKFFNIVRKLNREQLIKIWVFGFTFYPKLLKIQLVCFVYLVQFVGGIQELIIVNLFSKTKRNKNATEVKGILKKCPLNIIKWQHNNCGIWNCILCHVNKTKSKIIQECQQKQQKPEIKVPFIWGRGGEIHFVTHAKDLDPSCTPHVPLFVVE